MRHTFVVSTSLTSNLSWWWWFRSVPPPPYVPPGPRWCRVVSHRPRFALVRYGWVHTYLLHLSLLGFLHERTMVQHDGGGACRRTDTDADAPSCTPLRSTPTSLESPPQACPSPPPPQLHPMQLHLGLDRAPTPFGINFEVYSWEDAVARSSVLFGCFSGSFRPFPRSNVA